MSVAPVVSVVLPVHDGGRTVDGAVESILSQSFTDWELLIHDDGSSDDSWERCRRWAERDARIRADRSRRNRGIGATMNTLVQRSSGPLVAIQEQDDRSHPERLRRQVEAMGDDRGIGICFTRVRLLEEAGRVRLAPPILEPGGRFPSTGSAMIEMMFVGRNQVQNPSVVYRREALESVPPFDERARLAVDRQMHIRVAHRYSVVGVREVLVDVNRGALGPHATQDRRLAERELRRCLRLLHRELRADPASPITTDLYRRALSAQLVVEGRRRGGWPAVPRLLAAGLLAPGTRPPWRSLREAAGRRLARSGS